MSWKKILKAQLNSGELQLKRELNVEWRLEQFMRGAAQITYREEHMNKAIQQIGSTWDKVNSNSEDGKALEVYLNRNSSQYGLNTEQRTEFLKNFGAPYLQGQ